MKVLKLTVRNFRNVSESSFAPSSHLNFLVGSNGQGKTSLIEALGYLATLRSFRGAKTEEVIQWGQDSAEISCTIGSEDPSLSGWNAELKVVFVRQGERTTRVAFINGKPYRSSTHYLSQRFGSYELGLHTVVFNPSDHDLVRGEPALRRHYLDRVIAAEDIDYLKLLQKYQRTLEQRNALFKAYDSPPRQLLAGFSEPLVQAGAAVTRYRLDWMVRLQKHLAEAARKIAPTQPVLKAVYVSSWVPEIRNLSIPNKGLDREHFAGQDPLPSLELLEQAFWKRLSVLEEAELRSRSSLVGPHRDDWAFFLGEQFLKGHGSQGEIRSALLALKLSEIELFQKRTGHRPLLLLDDFSSELDRERRAFLLSFLMETDLQVFVTTTEGSLQTSGKRFRVSQGSLVESRGELDPAADVGNVPTNMM